MTKEEIIKLYEPYPNKADINIIGAMMDEYAKRECILFAEWCAKEKYIYRYPSKELWISMKSETHYTSKQLYQLYIQDKQKTT